MGQILRKCIDLMETIFFVKQVKWDKYYRKKFCSSKCATYSSTKLFWYFDAFSPEIDKKILFAVLKVTISERS